MTSHPGAGRPPAALLIAGPTASGKSALAADLAAALDGTVINADSIQIYDDLRILSARPGPAELARAPHRLYGILPGSERCSAGRWRDLASAAIAEAREEGRRPILVGGTGLYFKALLEGLSPIPDVPAGFRAAATARHAALGGPEFHRALQARDPVMAGRLQPGDTQRLIRAWEVLEATGRSLAEWQALPRRADPPPPAAIWIGLAPPRGPLYRACDARFGAMLGDGALAEAAALQARHHDPDLPVMKGVGVPPLLAHLAGRMTLDQAAAQARLDTRHYAKRQLTWFRHQSPAADPAGPICATLMIDAQYSQSFLPEIIRKLQIH